MLDEVPRARIWSRVVLGTDVTDWVDGIWREWWCGRAWLVGLVGCLFRNFRLV